MKVVILAGGFGTRLSEETVIKPKPMVEIGDEPILIHLMKYYSSYGFNEFVLALGYKSDYIKEYLFNYMNFQNNLLLDFQNKKITQLENKNLPWKIQLIETGKETNTGGRLKKLQNYLDGEQFLFTYGDGLSNVNLSKLLQHHKQSKSIVTLTGVKAPPKFGNLKIVNKKVIEFSEKGSSVSEWINGGFMVMENKIFDYISSSTDSLEFDTLEKIAKEKKLSCYKHKGFWQCMDSLKDKTILEDIWKSKKAPWKK
tara:strand:- start:151 stop:915 length:765 start_codon:yes stop_codon:yes gene_type:complete